MRAMLETNFHERVDDALLSFAVIIARHRGQWVFCRHTGRDTYECPGGHREPGEAIDDAAKRELWEETGARSYTIAPVCAYSVRNPDSGNQSYGMLYAAEIESFGELPPFEIEEVRLFGELPDRWTYPQIQPFLIKRYMEINK